MKLLSYNVSQSTECCNNLICMWPRYCRLTGLVCSFFCDFVFTRSGCLKNKILYYVTLDRPIPNK